MNMKKLLAGGVVGGITFFLLGWAIYGMALKGYMEAHQVPGVMKSEAEMMGNMLFMVLSNLCWGFMMAYVFVIANVNSIMDGAKTGLIVGLLTALAMDLGMYAMSNWFDGLSTAMVDVAATAVMTALGGAVIGFVNSKVS